MSTADAPDTAQSQRGACHGILPRLIETSVLIVGGGPVGLTLGMDLAQRNVPTLVVEARAAGAAPSPKCNHISARSMEIFRRLGVASALRSSGLPEDYPNDVSYRVSFTGRELARIPIPCRRDRYTAQGGPDTWWPTAEPPHRINQIYIEPILFAHAATFPCLTVLNRVTVEGLTQDDEGVTAAARNLDTGEMLTIRAGYAVGCDGPRSMVRKTIGATLSGTAVVQRVQSTFIRAPSLLALANQRPAWSTFSFNPVRSGNVYAIDGRETWLVHNYLQPGEEDFDAVDRDWALRTILGTDAGFDYDVLSTEDWIGRRLVADKLRDRRIFICGDAAHIWVPMAGYGMNAGIADAANLAWMLAAHLAGWASAAILDAHERERLPITEQVSHFAMGHSIALAKQRAKVPLEIDDHGPAGEAAREMVGRQAYDLNVQQYCCGGLNFGYFYDVSPIIAYDGEAPPAYGMAEFTPSTVPGCRTPHVWLAEGRSLYDALGPGYTLLRFDPTADTGALEAAARSRSMPLQVLDVTSAEALALYRCKLLLCRPDQHVAWRGEALPVDPAALVDLVCGAASPAGRLGTQANHPDAPARIAEAALAG